jgi:DNA repair exonuclease SbcCD ATPase subunit
LAAESATEGEAPAAVSDEPASEQVRLQAVQLAGHLRERQRELDDRQAALNCQMARLESDARAARLWLGEQQAELSARGEALAAGRQELSRRQQELSDQQASLSEQQQELSQQQTRLLEQEQELALREREVEKCLGRLAAAEAAVQLREQQAAERLAAAEQSASLGQRLADEHAEALAEMDQKRQAVERRAEHVEQSRAALRQLRDELGRMHRETLEIRLATEELWAQLSGAAPPAALVRSLGQIRSKLAQQYAQAGAELSQQKRELEAIRGQLAVGHEKLIEHKRQFDQWTAGRQQDTQQQATRLIAREQHLHQEEVRLREQFVQWQAERRKYRRQLRRGAGKSAVV